VSLAQRLLSGAGRASLLAYDLAPTTEASALAHGLSRTGELLVACIADDEIPATTWERTPLRVRFDIVKEAPEWSARITACALHLLGTLEWLTDETRDRHLADGVSPWLTELASSPGGRLGVVQTDRVLLHDCAGVTPLALEELADVPAFPGAEAEWEARDVVGRLSPAELDELLGAAASGWLAATVLAGSSAGGCSHMQRQVYCVDVDRTGLTLMDVEPGRTAVVVLGFDQPADSIEELADGLHQLLESAARSVQHTPKAQRAS
jgi:hypothetical protein